jgi:hypothetical protein
MTKSWFSCPLHSHQKISKHWHFNNFLNFVLYSGCCTSSLLRRTVE